MTILGALAWAYLILAAYTALCVAILAWKSPPDARQAAANLRVSVPVMVLGLALFWPGILPLLAKHVLGSRPRR